MDGNKLLKAIQKLSNKQCAFDPIPTWLLEKLTELISSFVKSVFNQSFSERIAPVFKICLGYTTVGKALSLPQRHLLLQTVL